MAPARIDEHHRIYDAGIPQGWGPGPWDDDWDDQIRHRASDLRPWRPGDPTAATRVPLVITKGTALRHEEAAA